MNRRHLMLLTPFLFTFLVDLEEAAAFLSPIVVVVDVVEARNAPTWQRRRLSGLVERKVETRGITKVRETAKLQTWYHHRSEVERRQSYIVTDQIHQSGAVQEAVVRASPLKSRLNQRRPENRRWGTRGSFGWTIYLSASSSRQARSKMGITRGATLEKEGGKRWQR